MFMDLANCINDRISKNEFHNKLMLGSHRSDDIHRLGRRNLVASDSSPKVRCQSISTTCVHSVLNSLFSPKQFFISIGDISKVIVVQ